MLLKKLYKIVGSVSFRASSRRARRGSALPAPVSSVISSNCHLVQLFGTDMHSRTSMSREHGGSKAGQNHRDAHPDDDGRDDGDGEDAAQVMAALVSTFRFMLVLGAHRNHSVAHTQPVFAPGRIRPVPMRARARRSGPTAHPPLYRGKRAARVDAPWQRGRHEAGRHRLH